MVYAFYRSEDFLGEWGYKTRSEVEAGAAVDLYLKSALFLRINIQRNGIVCFATSEIALVCREVSGHAPIGSLGHFPFPWQGLSVVFIEPIYIPCEVAGGDFRLSIELVHLAHQEAEGYLDSPSQV